MKPVRIQKDSTRTLVEQLPDGNFSREYVIEGNAHLALVLIASDFRTATASVRIQLTGSGASATITGLIMGKKSSKLQLSTVQIHEAPDTTSDLLVKSVLGQDAQCLYDGAIRVEKDAQKTDAYQRNENLLLSDTAHAESKPSLEILANDVRCTHGATVGPIPEDELWYLATRGIGEEKAKELIVIGFLESALRRIADERVRNEIRSLVRMQYNGREL